MKSLEKQCTNGMCNNFKYGCVHGVEIQAAAERLAKHLGVKLLTSVMVIP